MSISEKDMQIIIANSYFAKRWNAIIPNCYSQFDNECDLFALRGSGFYDEIEIKVTKSDFKNDSKKSVKILNENSSSWRDRYIDTPKHEALEVGDPSMANYYWYAIPVGLVDHSEIPAWAGIIEVSVECDKNGDVLLERCYAREVRMPKRLHSTKMPLEEQLKQVRKLGYRYWNLINKS